MTAPKGTILVTGANGGLGTAIVKNIIARPDLAAYHGVYTVRDVAAASSLQSALRTAKSHPHDVLPLDLSKQSSVRETAAVINAKVSNGEIPQIRALILNAGYREWPGRTRIEDGLDITFSSNYLGHWLLTLLLLQSMDRESGRVVIVGGWVHDPLDEANKANGAFEDEQWKKIFADASSETVESVAKAAWSPSPDDPSKDRKGLSGIRRYGAAKLCSVMMIFELQRRLDSDPELSGISVLGVDPGIMATNITTMTLGWLVRIIFSVVAQIANWAKPNGIMRQPHKSAGDVLAAALETDPPFGKRPKGMYFNGSDLKEPSAEAKDAAKRATVWKTSIKYTELKEGETCLTDWS
ncbi:putative short-chain dehydrogenase [Annulohypoxylon truncatum]|uniref:putative short-chain dehydrogenase n=1 Tax=Annulohypoxylon truncatum TaxID=327061 RepID=UPI0020088701|nr:putative short-chain dehydrogenase [Annulohypoxylon truncatum]KAI1211126.1 putative short-chain dehydrogenase [Annulohypoxylon truncatum]